MCSDFPKNFVMRSFPACRVVSCWEIRAYVGKCYCLGAVCTVLAENFANIGIICLTFGTVLVN